MGSAARGFEWGHIPGTFQSANPTDNGPKFARPRCFLTILQHRRFICQLRKKPAASARGSQPTMALRRGVLRLGNTLQQSAATDASIAERLTSGAEAGPSGRSVLTGLFPRSLRGVHSGVSGTSHSLPIGLPLRIALFQNVPGRQVWKKPSRDLMARGTRFAVLANGLAVLLNRRTLILIAERGPHHALLQACFQQQRQWQQAQR